MEVNGLMIYSLWIKPEPWNLSRADPPPCINFLYNNFKSKFIKIWLLENQGISSKFQCQTLTNFSLEKLKSSVKGQMINFIFCWPCYLCTKAFVTFCIPVVNIVYCIEWIITLLRAISWVIAQVISVAVLVFFIKMILYDNGSSG